MSEAIQRRMPGEHRLLDVSGFVTALVIWTGPADQITLASGGEDEMIRCWDATTGAELDVRLAVGSWVNTLVTWTGPDGHMMLASGGSDGTIRCWDATTGVEIGKHLYQRGSIQALATWTGPDGHRMLASGGRDGTILRWDATTGVEIGKPLITGSKKVKALVVEWTRDGDLVLASGGEDGRIRRWDATTGTQIGISFIGGRLRRRGVEWVNALVSWTGPDGDTVLASGSTNGIRRWDATAGTEIGKPLSRHTGIEALVAWTGPDGHMMLASADSDETIRRWDATAGIQIGKPLSRHAGIQALVAWTGPDGHAMLASGGTDGTIRRWDAVTCAPVGDPMTGHTGGIWALAAWTTPDGYPLLASVSNDGGIRRWHALTMTPWGEPLTYGPRVGDISASTAPDGRTLLAAYSDGQTGIRCWDATTATTIGNVLRHPWPLSAIATWTGPGGHIMLASGDFDGRIQRWDATTGVLLPARMGPRFRFIPTGSVARLVAWSGPDGAILACLDERGTVRCWDATTGAAIGKPLRVADPVDRLAAWIGVDGPILAVASGQPYDGKIRRWNATTGTEIGEPLPGHAGGIGALVAWTGPDGSILLASGGWDGKIRRWDASTGTEIGEPLAGHTGRIGALVAWTGPDGNILLASGGIDGVIRVSDTVTGKLLSRALVEPIRLRGLADRPAQRDLLSRTALTQSLANMLLWHPTEQGGDTGPSVVTIEGPWGTGKTTIMQLVQSRIAAKPDSQPSTRHLSVAATRKILRKDKVIDALRSSMAPTENRGTLTAWFNAWVSQSSEQVWAGLARSIADAAKPVLYPDDAPAQAQAYWLARNAPRIDRFAVSRSALVRSLSPLLGFSVVIAVATLLISLVKLNRNTLFHVSHWRITPGVFVLVAAVVFLLAGLAHTIMRYFGPADRFLPPDIVRGPVLSASFGESAPEMMRLLRDPTYVAKSGYLAVVQADAVTTIHNLRRMGYELVVFVDDLDRCGTRTTVEVFEALNLFLSDPDLEVRFVIGLDPAIVAARLDDVYKDFDDRRFLRYGDDPSAGWAFLRKVVQLPVSAPHITDDSIDQFLGAALDVRAKTPHVAADIMNPGAPANQDNKVTDPPECPPALPDHLSDVSATARRERVRTGPVERQPEVLALLRRRFIAQPERSARETKRLLNVWQLYQRVLDLAAPSRDDEENVRRACDLVFLAEIITRWPALQRQLNKSRDGRRGLQLLAVACNDDDDWTNALKATELDGEEFSRAVTNLRNLLRECQSIEVADLAAKVL